MVKQNLVIVESPTKAKTIERYLGKNFKVVASKGHLRDLPKSKMGVDIEHNYEPHYISIRGKGDLIKSLKKEAAKADAVYLASDPDREGEAISWHLAHLLGLDLNAPIRVEFNEITKDAIKEAFKNPRKIDMDLVDAQQARRILDRLVGYTLSPILWKKVKKGLSAGRVQSIAVKLIIDRENEIKAFVPEEYWTLEGQFKKEKKAFTANYYGTSAEKANLEKEKTVKAVMSELSEKKPFTVTKVTKKERKRNPAAPFTTSSLQQDAGNKLNFNAKKTMMIAQQLYEGVDVKGRGTTGLITYLRTDSVRVSDAAKQVAKELIVSKFGAEYSANNVFSNKKKDIQDAHEAIRPAIIELEPELIKDSLTADQFKLYKLIWNRFMASQMSQSKSNSMQVSIANGIYGFKANGSELLFDGFRRLYNTADDEGARLLPSLEKDEKLKAESLKGEQSFTQPPARYTEASLVKELEDKDIGRPSTYAPIVSTLTERKYVGREKKALKPTELGFLVNDLMEEYFKDIVDAGFTANMENRLDDVEVGSQKWKDLISEFYGPFKKELDVADSAIEKIVVEDVPTGELCELCGKPMVIKAGRFGDFIACSGYPECKNTKPIIKTIGVKCPNCGKDIVARKSKRGRLFYGCSGYPECKTVFWNKPTDKRCPECNSILLEKKTKNKNFVCSNEKCGYTE